MEEIKCHEDDNTVLKGGMHGVLVLLAYYEGRRNSA